MFNPAYIVSEEQIDYFVNSLEKILSSINGGYE
jgi:acetylornithine/succinyldiaminopimelate/putrescine aminotransferase